MLTEEQIFQQLDDEINVAFNEGFGDYSDFSVDYGSKTILWRDVEQDQYCVNQFFVSDDKVQLGAMPIMTFPGEVL